MPRLQKPALLATQADVAGYLTVALEDESPDARQAAISRVASTRHVHRAVVAGTLSLIVRTDESPLVRCVAIGVLVESTSPTSAETLTAVIAAEEDRSTVRMPQPQVRAAALDGLSRLAGRPPMDTGVMLVDSSVMVEARRAAARLLATDRSRDVRMAAARFLGCCRDDEAISALIAALDQRDFGVVYQAESSLTSLTGQTFAHDARAWRGWIASQPNPFVSDSTTDEVSADQTVQWWARPWLGLESMMSGPAAD